MRSLHPWPIFPINLEPPAARSLCIQFILQELITAFERLASLQISTPEQLVGVDIRQELTAISQELEKFLLFSLENPFTQKGGVLDKLCFYCEILLQASNVSDPEIFVLLEEMKNSILRMRSKLIVWKKMTSLHPLDQILSQLLELYSELRCKLSRFFTVLSLFIQEARSDENVLIFLIENRLKLNGHLGNRTIEDLLQRFFPAGHAQLRAVICEGYTRRGFNSYFAQAEPMIDEIEWETVPLQTMF